jgi:hypothetical protein
VKLRDSIYGSSMPADEASPGLDVLLWETVEIAPRQGLRLTIQRLQSRERRRVALFVGDKGYLSSSDTTRPSAMEIFLRERDSPYELLAESPEQLLCVECGPMLVSEREGRRVYRCGGEGRFDDIVLSLEIISWQQLLPAVLAHAELAKKPIEHSGRMVHVGGKRPVPADLVEHVGRIEGVDAQSHLYGPGLSRRLDKGVSAEEVVHAIGEDDFVLLTFEQGGPNRHLAWLRRSAVTGIYPMKSETGTIIKLRSDGPFRDEEDLYEQGFHARGLTVKEVKRLFGW